MSVHSSIYGQSELAMFYTLSLALNTALYHHAARAFAAAAVRPASTVPLSVMTVNSLSGEVEMTRSSLRTIIHQLEDDTPRALSVRNTVL